jgi:hypothetical protein
MPPGMPNNRMDEEKWLDKPFTPEWFIILSIVFVAILIGIVILAHL